MKVLIIHPDPKILGGIQLYYQKISAKFTLNVDHFIIGKRPKENDTIKKVNRLISDYVRYVILLRKKKYDLIHLNPSLEYKMFFRDGLFHLLAKLSCKKTVVFFRGWNKRFEYLINSYGIWLFKLIYNKADIFIVLAEEFKDVLVSWDCMKPISREVTIIDENIYEKFDINKIINDRLKHEKWRILFLARIVREKGVYETVVTLEILNKKYPEIELIIAGEGDELKRIKKLVLQRGIKNVVFPGYVNGQEKTNLMKKSHILFLPTYYGEGLPNSIAESMAFGLPILTRFVGGINDFFINGEHGYATNSKNPKVFSYLIEKMFLNKNLYKKISLNNFYYAKTYFPASQAAKRLEKIYKSLA